MSEQELFHTRKISNAGKQMPIRLPTGEKTEHWLHVGGRDSDSFRAAETIAKRSAVGLALIESDQKRAEQIRLIEVTCIASLVSDWSFKGDCTQDAVVKFLLEAPQIADDVNTFAGNRNNFFGSELDNFIDGSKPKSNSKESQKAPK